MTTEKPFWETLSLEEMSPAQWESLCDGCGRCCAVKIEDEDSGEVHYTRAACRLLDLETCRCRAYEARARAVKDCLLLTPADVREYQWLPRTCAYRRLAEGRPLAWWHPLVSGSAHTVHIAGISARGQLVSERHVHPDDVARTRLEWPDDDQDD